MKPIINVIMIKECLHRFALAPVLRQEDAGANLDMDAPVSKFGGTL